MYLFVIQVCVIFFCFQFLPFPFGVSVFFFSCFDQFVLTFCFALSSFANLPNYIDMFAFVSDHWIQMHLHFWCHPQPLFYIFNLLLTLLLWCFSFGTKQTKKKNWTVFDMYMNGSNNMRHMSNWKCLWLTMITSIS